MQGPYAFRLGAIENPLPHGRVVLCDLWHPVLPAVLGYQQLRLIQATLAILVFHAVPEDG